MNKRTGISLAILIMTSLMIIVFSLGVFTSIIISNQKIINHRNNIIKEDNKQILFVNKTDDCEDMNLFNTSDCLSQEVQVFYKYNESNTGKNFTLDELKEFGGVCRHYADYYVERLKQLGGVLLTDEETHFVRDNESDFYIKKVLISANKNINHVFVVVSNNDGYCVLDGKFYFCLGFGDNR